MSNHASRKAQGIGHGNGWPLLSQSVRAVSGRNLISPQQFCHRPAGRRAASDTNPRPLSSAAIPAEACYLGWQESLTLGRNLLKLKSQMTSKARCIVEPISATFGFWPLLATKIEFSYEEVQTVNLLPFHQSGERQRSSHDRWASCSAFLAPGLM